MILSSGFRLSEFSFAEPDGTDRTSLDDVLRRETAFAAMFAEVKPLPSHPVRGDGRNRGFGRRAVGRCIGHAEMPMEPS